MNSDFAQGTVENMHRDNWDDLRYVLAVAEAGSVSGAARVMGVNHATVLRHISDFEARHGVQLFDKSGRGYEVLPENLRLIDAAREVETAVMAVARLIEGAQAPLHGVVRVTSTDTFCALVLPPLLARLLPRSGELRLEILSTNAHVDLGRFHADVTVRPTDRLPEDLSGSVVGRLGFGHYAAPGLPGDAPWLGLSGPLSRSKVAAWMATALDPGRISGGADSFVTLAGMAAAGLGQAILPCVAGEGRAGLERRHGLFPPTSVDIWVASHADLAEVPRLRAARALLGEALAADAARLAGVS
jgi:DNA-binding transcriptional LysR family regulator